MSNIEKLKTYKHILMLVEFPNKIKTIQKILKELGFTNIFVKASIGHISGISDSGVYNMGIDPTTFKMDLNVLKDKKDVFNDLKSQVNISDFILLASDPDREGEAIAYSLKKFLKIKDDNYQRIVYHEITKSAIEKALNNPLKIDEQLVSAAHTRSRLDKIVGYRLSPIAIKQLSARSVGRCQSAGLKLVVDREKEIKEFKPVTYYEMYLNFSKNKVDFRAKYQGSIDKKYSSKLKSIKECDEIAKDCKGKDYFIVNKEEKLNNQNAPLPFITSSFQQECSSKLGIGVKQAMSYAQKLFEGIDINGQHVALTTYLRTDSSVISEEFVPLIKNYILKNYGKEYYQGVRETKKKENAQEGHECFRILDLSMTPENLSNYVKDEKLIKVYRLIYNRTVASLMSARKVFETKYTISNGDIHNYNHLFELSSKEEVFDGWKKVYNVEKEKDEIIKETFKIVEVLQNISLERVEKETQPHARYTEATLIKELEAKNIGRPSTYATIISTLLDEKRNYCKVVDKKMYATDLAISLVDFLDKYFTDIVDSNYTANLEKSLDKISEGKLKDIDFLKAFYFELENNIAKEEKENGCSIDKKCPNCGATLVIRRGRFGNFLACPNYPNCKHTEKLS